MSKLSNWISTSRVGHQSWSSDSVAVTSGLCNLRALRLKFHQIMKHEISIKQNWEIKNWKLGRLRYFRLSNRKIWEEAKIFNPGICRWTWTHFLQESISCSGFPAWHLPQQATQEPFGKVGLDTEIWRRHSTHVELPLDSGLWFYCRGP